MAKLQHRYTGPHTIVKVINPTTYLVGMGDKECAIHATKIKRNPMTNRKSRFYDVPEDIADGVEIRMEIDDEDLCIDGHGEENENEFLLEGDQELPLTEEEFINRMRENENEEEDEVKENEAKEIEE